MQNLFENKQHRLLILIPLLIGVLGVVMIPSIPQGTDITGGTTISASLPAGASADVGAIEERLAHFNLYDLSVRVAENPLDDSQGVIIEFVGNIDLIEANKVLGTNPRRAEEIAAQFIPSPGNATTEDWVMLANNKFSQDLRAAVAAELGVDEMDLGFREVGPTLGAMFWEQGIRAIVLAFILMSVVVFLAFREFMPSVYVVSSAVIDILGALLGMAVFGVQLSLPTFVALLMLIGYSVDTDIMLTNKVAKRRDGTKFVRTEDAMRTGLTMTGTTLAAVGVLAVSSYLLQVTTLFQISAVLLFGLAADLASTWLMNAPLLLWWLERKGVN
ncbi:MAG: hypothetical protein JW834_02850 [Candidatus Diapherotrites archaeon]|nr:hypothetical protein [Candidatus Diapherotrites archaeon]